MPANFPLGVSDDDRIVFNVATSMWERGTGGGAPARVILPVYDGSVSPDLSYKVEVSDASALVAIQGENLTGITDADVSTDVNVDTNSSPAPTVLTVSVISDAIVRVTLDCTACISGGDFWGLILRDAAGNAYGAPSPIMIFAPT